jgi:peptidoglycan-associated lipoprotein
MTTRISVLTIVAVALIFGGCSKAKKKDTVPPNANSAKTVAPAKTTKVAEGDMRDALLSLRKVHFGLDSATLPEESRNALTDAAEKLALHPDVTVYVDGHTDERGTTEYNVALGERRAQAAVDYLSRSGVDASRLQLVSFGMEQPVASGSGEVSWAKNRRVEFRLRRGDVRLVLEEGTLLNDAGAPITQ